MGRACSCESSLLLAVGCCGGASSETSGAASACRLEIRVLAVVDVGLLLGVKLSSLGLCHFAGADQGIQFVLYGIQIGRVHIAHLLILRLSNIGKRFTRGEIGLER